ncbi:hypothetical protein [Actinomadura sp. CNU-125]|uniref:hypothetical protein n=1 Tax=Actinomadura sp. CNU-125 TaxID=1904961 RepID=UPI003967A615
MDLTYSAADEAFRRDVRDWLETHLRGDFAGLRGLGGPGREDEAFGERLDWDRHLGAHGWTCLGWPAEHGGRGLCTSTAPEPRRRSWSERPATAGRSPWRPSASSAASPRWGSRSGSRANSTP